MSHDSNAYDKVNLDLIFNAGEEVKLHSMNDAYTNGESFTQIIEIGEVGEYSMLVRATNTDEKYSVVSGKRLIVTVSDFNITRIE